MLSRGNGQELPSKRWHAGTAYQFIWENVALALVYWGVSHLNWLAFASVGVLPMPMWPAAAVALAAAMYRRWAVAPGIALGTVLANHFSLGAPWDFACAIAVMNTLGPITAALIINHRMAKGHGLRNVDDVLVNAAAAVVLAPMLTATGGIGGKWLLGLMPGSVVPVAWLRWFVAHAAGTLIFAPPLLAWLGRRDPADSEPDNSMPAAVLWAGATLTLLLWTATSFLDYLWFNPAALDFWDCFFPLGDPHELIMRLMYVASILLGAMMVSRMLARLTSTSLRLEHLNRVLRAIRNVNQLITHEKDRQALLEQACRLMVETRGFDNAWISLVDNGKPIEPFCHAGFNGGFAPLSERLRAGTLPECAQRALHNADAQIVGETLGECDDCPFPAGCGAGAGLAVRLEHGGRVFGWLTVGVSGEHASDKDEHDLLGEMAGDIAFALWSIESDEKHRALQERYHLFVESLPVGVYQRTVGEDNRLTLANAMLCEMLGYEAEELMNLGTGPIYANQEQRHRFNDSLNAEGRADGFDLDIVRKDGSHFPARVWAQVHGAGEFSTVEGVLIDVSEQARLRQARDEAEAQLRQAQRMEAIGQLAGGVAHDFNNLLQVILGGLDMALDDLPPNAPAAESLHEVAAASNRAATLVSQLLAFSRRQTMNPKDLDLNEIVDDLLKMLHRVIGEHIRLDTIPGHNLGTVHADRGMLEQVLMNLCVNARDAMPEGGKLIIETENVAIDSEYCETHMWAKPGRYVLLSVTDTGQGMDREILEHIFEPFFSTKGEGKGTGLGLATVYGIVKQHEGMIFPYSEPGKGTTIKVYLPSVERQAADIETKVRSRVLGGTETILVAEDDASVRKMARTLLERAGYTVVAAENGQRAVEYFRENPGAVDLLMLDIIMPEMGGREAYEAIQAIRPGIPTLFASGYSEGAVHTDFVLDEGLKLIRKPFARDALLRTVREILDEAR